MSVPDKPLSARLPIDRRTTRGQQFFRPSVGTTARNRRCVPASDRDLSYTIERRVPIQNQRSELHHYVAGKPVLIHIFVFCKGMTMTPNQNSGQGSKQKGGSSGQSRKQGSDNSSSDSRTCSQGGNQEHQEQAGRQIHNNDRDNSRQSGSGPSGS